MTHTKKLAAGMIVLALVAGSDLAHGQTRSVGAHQLILDDGTGRTMTLITESPLPVAAGGNLNYVLATPPAGNPQAGFVNVGTTGQTLYWNGAVGHNAWEASSILQNNIANLTMTAPLAIQSPTATASTLSLQAPSGGNSTSFRAQAQGTNITYTLPAAQSSIVGQVLTNDGTGNLSWVTAGSNSAQVVSTNSTYTGGSALSTNQNNLAINNNSTYFKIDASSDVDVTGIDASTTSDGRVVYFSNIGTTAHTVTFRNLSGSSLANNQFKMSGDVTIGNDATATFIYDATTHKWRLVAAF